MTQTMCDCGKPTAGAVLCEDCVKTFAYAVANVGAYYADMGTVARKQTRFGTGAATKGSVGKSQPLPVDMRFVNAGGTDDDDTRSRAATLAPGNQLRWDAWNTVVAWCRDVMAKRPEIPGPACDECIHLSCVAVRRGRWPWRGKVPSTVPAMVNYLSRQFRWIIREQWAPVMFSEFLDLERRLARFVDRPADRWYAGKCSAPGTLADQIRACETELYATVDKGFIECPTCKTRHDVAERREFLLEEAKGYLVTATEGAAALLAWTDYDGSLEKLVDRIRKWGAADGPLEKRGEVEIGGKNRSLYRLGDIQERMIAAAQKAQEKRIGGAA